MNYVKARLDPKWLDIPYERWHRAAVMDGGLAAEPELAPLLDELRAVIPMPGAQDWRRERHVLLEYGERIAAHTHDEWVALYYVFPGDPPANIHIEGEEIPLTAGDVIAMAPGTLHHVLATESKKPRLAFAMLVPVPLARIA